MNLIKEFREKQGMTQRQLANEANVSIRTIQGIEQNIRKPSTKLILKLFKILKIPLTRLEIFLSSYTTK